MKREKCDVVFLIKNIGQHFFNNKLYTPCVVYIKWCFFRSHDFWNNQHDKEGFWCSIFV